MLSKWRKTPHQSWNWLWQVSVLEISPSISLQACAHCPTADLSFHPRVWFAVQHTDWTSGHHSLTIRCLYSSEASCTAVSHALGLVEYTLFGSSFQYLNEEKRTPDVATVPSIPLLLPFLAGCVKQKLADRLPFFHECNRRNPRSYSVQKDMLKWVSGCSPQTEGDCCAHSMNTINSRSLTFKIQTASRILVHINRTKNLGPLLSLHAHMHTCTHTCTHTHTHARFDLQPEK